MKSSEFWQRINNPRNNKSLICCCCSVSQLCPTLCNPMDCSMPGFPELQHILELAQTHVHRVPSNRLILCRPLLLLPSILPSIRTFPMSLLFSSHGQSIGVSASASILPKNIQSWSPLGWTGWISLLSKGLSVFSSTTIQKHQSFSAQPSSQSNSHIHTWLLEKPQLWLHRPLLAKWCLYF